MWVAAGVLVLLLLGAVGLSLADGSLFMAGVFVGLGGLAYLCGQRRAQGQGWGLYAIYIGACLAVLAFVLAPIIGLWQRDRGGAALLGGIAGTWLAAFVVLVELIRRGPLRSTAPWS